MYKYSYVLVFLICLSSCAQQTKEPQNTTPTTMDIKAILEDDPYIDQLQKYDYEPLYQIRISSSFCYEIRLNDIVVIRKNNDYMNHNIANLNASISESGVQNLNIKIYPRFSNGEKLENDQEFTLKIEKTSWENGSLTDPKEILVYEVPKFDSNNNEIDLSKFKVFSDEKTFEAEIPYKLKDWTKGIVFNEKDSLSIMPELLSAYKELKKYHENQNGEEYMNSLKDGYFNIYQANYFTKEEAQNKFNIKKKLIDKKKRILAPIENYYIEFSGKGKLVSLKRNDGHNKGEGVLRRYYKKNGIEKVSVDDILFYKPNKRAGFKVIWYSGLVKKADL
jgi:hypothetical protein